MTGCTVFGVDCDVHHLVEFDDGGQTDIDNLAFACPFHHQRIDRWTLELRDGRIWCTPAGKDPATHARRNNYFRDPPRPSHLGAGLPP